MPHRVDRNDITSLASLQDAIKASTGMDVVLHLVQAHTDPEGNPVAASLTVMDAATNEEVAVPAPTVQKAIREYRPPQTAAQRARAAIRQDPNMAKETKDAMEAWIDSLSPRS